MASNLTNAQHKASSNCDLPRVPSHFTEFSLSKHLWAEVAFHPYGIGHALGGFYMLKIPWGTAGSGTASPPCGCECEPTGWPFEQKCYRSSRNGVDGRPCGCACAEPGRPFVQSVSHRGHNGVGGPCCGCEGASSGSPCV